MRGIPRDGPAPRVRIPSTLDPVFDYQRDSDYEFLGADPRWRLHSTRGSFPPSNRRLPPFVSSNRSDTIVKDRVGIWCPCTSTSSWHCSSPSRSRWTSCSASCPRSGRWRPERSSSGPRRALPRIAVAATGLVVTAVVRIASGLVRFTAAHLLRLGAALVVGLLRAYGYSRGVALAAPVPHDRRREVERARRCRTRPSTPSTRAGR